MDLQQTILTMAGLLIAGFPLRAAGRRLGIPPAASLMLLGLLAGTHVFDFMADAYHERSPSLSIAAFVILLLRAGLGMEPRSMKKMVPGIVLIGVVPAVIEMSVLLVGIRSFLFDRWDLAFLAAFLIAAVSPAVILPTMLDQKAKGRGGPRLVPDRIMGMAVMNSFVAKTAIVLLLALIAGTEQDGAQATTAFYMLPLRLLGGIVMGAVLGRLVVALYPRREPNPALLWGGAALVLLAAMLLYFQARTIHIEGVFAVLAFGISIRLGRGLVADGFKDRFNGLWKVAEIPLFVNIGALIDVSRLTDPLLIVGVLGLMVLGLATRKWAAWWCTRAGDLTKPERFYVTLAQVPKATIQAVFGPVVYLTLVNAGKDLEDAAQLILIMAVLAIIATAPIGAVILDRWGARLLPEDTPSGS